MGLRRYLVLSFLAFGLLSSASVFASEQCNARATVGCNDYEFVVTGTLQSANFDVFLNGKYLSRFTDLKPLGVSRAGAVHYKYDLPFFFGTGGVTIDVFDARKVPSNLKISYRNGNKEIDARGSCELRWKEPILKSNPAFPRR